MKKTITLTKINAKKDSSFVAGTAAERLGYVWPLTEELCGIGKKYDAKQRLQRTVINIQRRKS
jgi:hypothetical protein